MIPPLAADRSSDFVAAGSASGGSWLPGAHRSTGGGRCCQTMPPPRLESRAPGRRGTPMTANHHGQRATPFVVASKSTVHDALGAKTLITISRSAEGAATTRPYPRRPGDSTDPVRPPALPDRHRRAALGQRSGAVPGTGRRGARRDTGGGGQRTISLVNHADRSIRMPVFAPRRQRRPGH